MKSLATLAPNCSRSCSSVRPCDPRKKVIVLVACPCVAIPCLALFYALAKTWPVVHWWTDPGSLLFFGLEDRALYNETGCGRGEAREVGPDFEENYGELRLLAVDACGLFFDNFLLRYVSSSAMFAYCLASCGLLCCACCSYNLWQALPWVLLQCCSILADSFLGLVFLFAFEPGLGPMNMDQSELSTEEWERKLRGITMDAIFFVISIALKTCALCTVINFLKMLRSAASAKTAAARSENEVERAEQTNTTTSP